MIDFGETSNNPRFSLAATAEFFKLTYQEREGDYESRICTQHQLHVYRSDSS